MGDLHRHRRRRHPVEVIAAEIGCEQDQGRSQTLTSGSHEFRHRRRDRCRPAVDLSAQEYLDGLQVGRDRTEEGGYLV
ncbi:MAG TPA: hypothetical protein VFB69_07600 [Candidatus Dormibacteraeota bacterium]|nr:hypothetical protein [Candidatus Dormibacteraeota bacterium]